jgi:TolA-binding protein
MGHQAISRSKLLAAVSVLSLSVGMVPALAADQNNQGTSTQIKGETHQIKLDSMQHKQNSNQLKLDSTQIKGESHQIKYDSMQHKQNSNQIKQDSIQLKQNDNTHHLNPQPLPPG